MKEDRKEKFTPGKWNIKECCAGLSPDYAEMRISIENETEEKRIAYCECMRPEAFYEIKANFALIAAAPEMYETLKVSCKMCCMKGKGEDCPTCRIGKVLRKARGEE